MADPVKHPAPDNLAHITGSSAPTGAPPTFESIATAAASVAPPASVDAAAATGGRDPVLDIICAHEAAYDAWTALVPEGSGLDLPSDGPQCEAHEATLGALVQAEPTTVPGLRTWIVYLNEIATDRGDWSAAAEALPKIAEAAERLLWLGKPQIGAHLDADLIAEGKEFDRILLLLKEAYDERYRLEAALDRSLPGPAAGMLVDPANRLGEDAEFLSVPVPDGDDSEQRYYGAAAVNRLRKVPRKKRTTRPLEDGDSYNVIVDYVPDPEAQARADRVIAAYELWDAECKRRPEYLTYEAARVQHLDLDARYGGLLALIETAVPKTLKGLAVQARAMCEATRSQLLQFAVAERLTEFAKAEGYPALTASASSSDPIVRLRAEVLALRDAVEVAPSDVAAEADMDRLYQLDQQVKVAAPTTIKGAATALIWAIEEMHAHAFDIEGDNNGDHVIRSLLESAAEFLRGQVAGDKPTKRSLDAYLLALGADLDDLERRKKTLLSQVTDPSVPDDAPSVVEYEALDLRCSDLASLIANEQAATLEGFKTQARAIAYIYSDGFTCEEVARGNGVAARLIWSILSELAAIEPSATLADTSDKNIERAA